MTILLDPENRETAALLDFAGELAGKRVLEIGCGNGRLTWRYAHLAEAVEAIDPKPERIAQAREAAPPALQGQVAFHVAELETYESHEPFDLVLLSWAL